MKTPVSVVMIDRNRINLSCICVSMTNRQLQDFQKWIIIYKIK